MVVCLWTVAAAAAPRTSFLLIIADDLGPHLGSYGDRQARTPHLDALAKEGVRFDRAYVTQASCSPSRSSIFTGLYPHQNGQIGLTNAGYAMHAGLPTLPKLLAQVGYRNAALGKIHVEPVADLPFHDALARSRGTDGTDGQSVAGALRVRKWARRAAEFIGKEWATPFLLVFSFRDPHRPYPDVRVGGLPAELRSPDEVEPFDFLALDTPAIRRDVAGYYDAVERLDAGVGALREYLRDIHLDQSTVIIFLGDHGPPFTRAKTSCYEAGLRVPLIVHWPGEALAGQVRNELVSTIDLLPTILEIAGVPAPSGLPGRSLVPLLRGETTPWREAVFAEYTSHNRNGFYPRRSVREERYKLILNLLSDRRNPANSIDGCLAYSESQKPEYAGTWQRRVYDTYKDPPAVELYDLRDDPNEFHNLADEPELAPVRRRLLERLRAWREETADPLLDEKALRALAREHSSYKGLPAPRAAPTGGSER